MPTHLPPENAKARFSDRVADYVKYRPGYPQEVVTLLKQCADLRSGSKVADIGSGTGIFSALLLEEGAEVYAVEPNREMREAAEVLLGGNSGFHSVEGSGEATTVDSGSMDLVVSAQAFHWLDRAAARREFSRILKTGGRIVLVWNVRQSSSSAFLRDYEQLLLHFAPDYAQVRHENIDSTTLTTFFKDGVFEKHRFTNEQVFDFASLSGRLLSCSYAPASGHPLHEPMMDALNRLFEQHQQKGQVFFRYDTEVFIGR